jgi:hypothetical protein
VDAPSSVELALDHFSLNQELVGTQLALPFPNVPADVRGILDVPEKHVFVVEATRARVRWVGTHEIGHYAIPDHRMLLAMCSTFDLSAAARKQLEVEANEFSAEFLFQGAKFVEECLSTAFSLQGLRVRCENYGVSYEAGFRRFVEGHPQPVALLVSRVTQSAPVVSGDGALATTTPRARLRYAAYSESFRSAHSFFQVGQEFAGDHPVLRAAVSGNDCTERTNYHRRDWFVSSFFNQYDVLSIMGLPPTDAPH